MKTSKLNQGLIFPRKSILFKQRFIFGFLVGMPTLSFLFYVFFTPFKIAPHELIISILIYFLSGIGIEIGYHRYITHQSFKANNFTKALLIILGSTAGEGPPIYWASQHRRHHEFSDQQQDPHSPHKYGRGIQNQIKGFFHAHFGWIFQAYQASPYFYCRDLLKDPIIFFFDRHYFWWFLSGLVFPGFICLFFDFSITGFLKGIFWAGIIRLFFVQQATFLINSVCHIFGKTNFKSNDRSKNNFLLALPTFGGSWHNNHHAFPSSATCWLRWWHVDICWLVILIASYFGLIHSIKVPEKREIASKKMEILL